eukprot:m.97487 g.97487  ORF g.97487 m.97487 type:complete len:402 (-) comp8667_c0_seq7:159-1364(-)
MHRGSRVFQVPRGSDLLPTQLEGYRVDVREGRFEQLSDNGGNELSRLMPREVTPDPRWNPSNQSRFDGRYHPGRPIFSRQLVASGCAFTCLGTIGCYMTTARDAYLLSNSHVLRSTATFKMADGTPLPGTPILGRESSVTIGAQEYYVDVALLPLTARAREHQSARGMFPNHCIPYNEDCNLMVDEQVSVKAEDVPEHVEYTPLVSATASQAPVYKYGAATGLTVGRISTVSQHLVDRTRTAGDGVGILVGEASSTLSGPCLRLAETFACIDGSRYIDLLSRRAPARLPNNILVLSGVIRDPWHRGEFAPWNFSSEGDSGSVVFTAQGAMVGLVWGRFVDTAGDSTLACHMHAAVQHLRAAVPGLQVLPISLAAQRNQMFFPGMGQTDPPEWESCRSCLLL